MTGDGGATGTAGSSVTETFTFPESVDATAKLLERTLGVVVNLPFAVRCCDAKAGRTEFPPAPLGSKRVPCLATHAREDADANADANTICFVPPAVTEKRTPNSAGADGRDKPLPMKELLCARRRGVRFQDVPPAPRVMAAVPAIREKGNADLFRDNLRS